MASLILVGAIIAIGVYNLIKYMFYKPPNFPPGPPRIPFFGSYLFVLLINYKHFQYAISTLCKYYKTNILGLYYGDIPMIALNDAESVKDSLFHLDFDGKPPVFMARLRDPDFEFRGIFFTDGPFWKNQRRFALRHLRDYGFGRRFDELEIEIGEEIQNLIDVIRNGPKYDYEKKLIDENGGIQVPSIFIACPANIFLKILTNERRSRKDYGDLVELGKTVFNFQRNADAWGRMISLDSIRSLLLLFPKMCGYNVLRKSSVDQYAFMKAIVDENLATYEDGHTRSILDMYINEMKLAESNNEPSFFYYEQLVMLFTDFLLPPSTAIPMTISFMIQRLIMHPHVARQIQMEIDEVVGNGRLPTLDDRINLPYTEAALREIMRLETLVPSGLPHFSLEDTTFKGYDIPKGTVIMPQLIGTHFDETVFENPYEFRPERFLDDMGKLDLKKDHSLPFGAGKRLCAGETFARNVLFLMVAALLQNFKIKPSMGYVPLEPQTGLISYLPDYTVQLIPR